MIATAIIAAITEHVTPIAYRTGRRDSFDGGGSRLSRSPDFVWKRAVFTGFPQATPAMLRAVPENYIKKQNDPGPVPMGAIMSAPPRADDSLPRSKNVPHCPYFSGPARIMAALPQLAQRESNKERKMIRCRIKQIQPACEMS